LLSARWRQTFVDYRAVGQQKIELLRRFRLFRDGTPSHDHLGDIFATPGIPAPLCCLGRQADRRVGGRDCHRRQDVARLLHKAGQSGGRSPEIIAIPALLDTLTIEAAVVSLSTVCAASAIEARQEADYILALKGNQGTPRDDVELFASEHGRRTASATPR
jgi:hypothetical protein